MPSKHAPRRGSLQFWPRVRARRDHAKVRTWPKSTDVKPLGFVGFKACMCHCIVSDNRPKSLTKGENISLPSTILECPPLKVAGINYYKKRDKGGLLLISTQLSKSLDKELSRTLPVAKKTAQKEPDFDDLRLLVHTQPKLTSIGSKKPKVTEIALGGKKEEKLAYAKEKLGKEITVQEVFSDTVLTDAHCVTKGKGFQGPVKRHGIMIKSHKSEKSRRGNIRGAWTGPKMWTVPHSAKMGYHQRVDYNKHILTVDQKDINPKSGLHKYGQIKNAYVVVKGSVGGPRKRTVTLVKSIRPNTRTNKDSFKLKSIIL